MKAAAVQFFATPFALERNLQTAERLAREAALAGARVIVLPELFNTGYVYTPRLFHAAESDDGPTVRWLKTLSAELGVLIGGAMLWRAGERCFDSFLLAEPDGRMHRYHKQHPFAWERCFFEAGTETGLAATGAGRIGLMVCWDAAFRPAWEALRGKVDLILISSAPPRLHRAVLNFPEARKVYLADLMPGLLRNREAIDDWYAGGVGRGAAVTGIPVVSAMMAGRFVTEMPYPRLSFALASAGRPRYWGWAGRAHQATLRATFYGASAVFGPGGGVLAGVTGEEGWAMAEAGGAVTPPSGPLAPEAGAFHFPHVPGRWRWIDSVFRGLGPLYGRNKQGQS